MASETEEDAAAVAAAPLALSGHSEVDVGMDTAAAPGAESAARETDVSSGAYSEDMDHAEEADVVGVDPIAEDRESEREAKRRWAAGTAARRVQKRKAPPALAEDHGFVFRPRVQRLDWMQVQRVNLNRVVADGQLDSLQNVLDTVAFGRVRPEDITSSELAAKAISTLQLIVEYSLFVQECQDRMIARLRGKTKHYKTQLHMVKLNLHMEKQHGRALKKGADQCLRAVQACEQILLQYGGDPSVLRKLVSSYLWYGSELLLVGDNPRLAEHEQQAPDHPPQAALGGSLTRTDLQEVLQTVIPHGVDTLADMFVQRLEPLIAATQNVAPAAQHPQPQVTQDMLEQMRHDIVDVVTRLLDERQPAAEEKKEEPQRPVADARQRQAQSFALALHKVTCTSRWRRNALRGAYHALRYRRRHRRERSRAEELEVQLNRQRQETEALRHTLEETRRTLDNEREHYRVTLLQLVQEKSKPQPPQTIVVSTPHPQSAPAPPVQEAPAAVERPVAVERVEREPEPQSEEAEVQSVGDDDIHEGEEEEQLEAPQRTSTPPRPPLSLDVDEMMQVVDNRVSLRTSFRMSHEGRTSFGDSDHVLVDTLPHSGSRAQHPVAAEVSTSFTSAASQRGFNQSGPLPLASRLQHAHDSAGDLLRQSAPAQRQRSQDFARSGSVDGPGRRLRSGEDYTEADASAELDRELEQQFIAMGVMDLPPGRRAAEQEELQDAERLQRHLGPASSAAQHHHHHRQHNAHHRSQLQHPQQPLASDAAAVGQRIGSHEGSLRQSRAGHVSGPAASLPVLGSSGRSSASRGPHEQFNHRQQRFAAATIGSAGGTGAAPRRVHEAPRLQANTPRDIVVVNSRADPARTESVQASAESNNSFATSLDSLGSDRRTPRSSATRRRDVGGRGRGTSPPRLGGPARPQQPRDRAQLDGAHASSPTAKPDRTPGASSTGITHRIASTNRPGPGSQAGQLLDDDDDDDDNVPGDRDDDASSTWSSPDRTAGSQQSSLHPHPGSQVQVHQAPTQSFGAITMESPREGRSAIAAGGDGHREVTSTLVVHEQPHHHQQKQHQQQPHGSASGVGGGHSTRVVRVGGGGSSASSDRSRADAGAGTASSATVVSVRPRGAQVRRGQSPDADQSEDAARMLVRMPGVPTHEQDDEPRQPSSTPNAYVGSSGGGQAVLTSLSAASSPEASPSHHDLSDVAGPSGGSHASVSVSSSSTPASPATRQQEQEQLLGDDGGDTLDKESSRLSSMRHRRIAGNLARQLGQFPQVSSPGAQSATNVVGPSPTGGGDTPLDQSTSSSVEDVETLMS